MKRMLSCLVVVSIVLGSFGAWAQEIWDGGGANGGDMYWGTAANWLDDSAPVAGSSIVFGQSFDLTNTNNLAGNVAMFAWMSFSNSAFTLRGSPFTLTGAGGMTNLAAANQIINNVITANVAQTWHNSQPTRMITLTSNLVLRGNLTLDGGGGFTFNQVISGAYSITLATTGTASQMSSTTMISNNTYSGGTFITASNRLSVAGAGATAGTGPIVINPGGQLYISGTGRTTANNLSIAGYGVSDAAAVGYLGAIRLDGGQTLSGIVTAAAPARIATYAANDNAINGQIIGSSTLQKTGVGSLALNNLTNLGFTGKWEVYSNGQLRARSDTSFGAVPGVYTADAITLNNGGRLMNNSTPLAIHANRGITIASTGGGIQSGWWAGINVNSVITGPGALTIVADSTPGWITLAGANTFNGNLNIDGRLRLGANEVLPNGAGFGNVQLNGGTVLLNTGSLRVMDMNGFSETINALNGGGALTNSRGNAVLTLGDNNASGSFTGVVASVANGTLRLVKIGAGAQSLLGDIRNGVGLHVASGFMITTGSFGGGVSSDAAGVLVARDAAAGRLSTPGTLALTNANLSFNPGAGVEGDLYAANDLVLDGTVNVYVTPLKAIDSTPFLLFSYTNSIVGSAASLNVQPAGTRYTAFTASDVAGGIAIAMTGSGGPATLNYIGTNASWNVTNAASFYNVDSASTDVFYHADTVVFGADVSTNVVNLTGALAPANVIVEGPSNLTFQGNGRLSGFANLYKGGTNILTVSNANDFDGAVVVTGGVLRVNNALALGTIAGATWVTNGGTLDVNGQNLGAEDFYLGGAGAGGTGAVINTGAQQVNAMQRVTLVADTVIGGASRFDIRHAGIQWPTNNAFLRTDGGTYSLTKTGTAEFAIQNANVSDGIGNIFVNSGLLRSEYGTLSLGNPAYTARVARGATLDIYSLTNAVNKYITLEAGAKLTSQAGGNAALNVLLGTITLNGAATNIVHNGVHQTLAGTITGAGSLTILSNGTTYVTGTNDWTGGLSIYTGTVNVGKSGGSGTLGTGSVTNNWNLQFTRTNDYTIANELVGRQQAQIYKQNLGTLTLDGMATNYLGNIQLQNGTLLIGPNFISGTNQLEFTSTNAVIASSDGTPRTISNLTWWSQGPNIGAGGDLTFSSPVNNNGGATKVMSVSNNLTRFTGTLYGVGTIAKRGPGELRFENTVAVSAFTNLEGRLTLTGAGAFTGGSATLTFGQGSIFDVAGVSGGWYLRQGQTLRGNVGVVGNALISNSFVRPGASAGTITFSNDVTFSNADVDFELSNAGTPGAGVNDYIETIGNLTLSGITTTRVTALNNQFASSYVLWTNGGARAGGAANLLLNVGIMTNSRYGFAINDADPQQIVLNVSGSAKTLAWQGDLTGFWNVKGSTNNFLDGVTPDAFWQADAVSFGGDSTRRTVTIAEPVAPALVTVSAPYTLNLAGSGKITGGATLYKTGGGTLIVNGAMDFTGATLISNGIVQARNATALGSAAGDTHVAANGTLDTYGQNLGYEHVHAVGAGYTNGGAIVNLSGTAQNQTLRRVTLTGDATFGGLSTWDLRGANIADGWLSTGGNAYNLVKVGTNTVRLVDVAVDAALADIEIRQGVLGFEATTTGLGDPMRTLTVFTNASLWLNSLNAPVAKNVILQDGGGVWLQGGTVGASQNFFVQPVVLSNGMARIDGGANALFTEFTGAGGLRKLGGGEVWLTGTNDFTGRFQMSAGTLRLITNGALSAASDILMEGGTLVLDNSRGNLGDRLNDSADIKAWGGTITLATTNSIGVTESIGNVRVERGGLTINVDQPVAFGTTSTLYIAGISQEQGLLNFGLGNANTYFSGQNPSNNYGAHIMVGGLTNGQTIPWATVNGAGFAHYSTTNGIWAPMEIAEFNAAADQTGQDLRFTFERDGGANVLTANRSINTIVVSNQYNTFIDLAGNDLTLTGSGYRQIGNDNFMITNSGGGGSLIAGDAVFFVNSATTRLAAATTLNSLDKEGGGTLILLGNHTYTGRTAIGGILQVGENNAASIPTDTPVYNHGTLRFLTTTDLDFSSNIQGLGTIQKYGNNTLTLSGTSNMVGGNFQIYSGAVVFAAGSATYMTNNGGTFGIGAPYAGPVATMTIEPGALLDLGPFTGFQGANWSTLQHSIINQDGGTFIIGTTNLNSVRFAHWAGSNTYNMAGGELIVSNRLTLAWDGRSYFNQSNGTVKVGQLAMTPFDNTSRVRTSQWNLVNGTLLMGPGGISAATNSALQQLNVWGGTLAAWKTNMQVSQRIPVNLNGTLTLDGVAGDTVEMLGRAAGTGGILKIGEGTAILAGTNTYGGGTIISNGVLVAKTFNALGSGDVTLSGGALNLSLAGLNEADLAGSFNQNTNPVGTVTLGTPLANMEQNVSGGMLAPNSTAGYRGFLVVGGPTNVTYTFAECFDDSVMLRITTGGVVNTILNNGTWNVPTKGTITLAPGVYQFDLRLGNGGGAANGGGAVGAGWWYNMWTMGFGVDMQGRDQEIVGNYIKMTDPGDGSLFLADTNGFTVPNAVNVTADSAISLIGAGGAKMTMSGAFGIGTQRLTVTNNMAGALDLTGDMTLSGTPTFDIATNVTVTAAGAIGGGANGINKDGPGALRLTGTNTYTGTTRVMAGVMELADFGEIGSSATLQIDAGAQFVATNLSAGTLHLLTGQTLQGNGTFEGGLITDAGSAVRPGSSPGALTMVGDLTADAGSTFTFELDGLTAGTGYDQLLFGGGNVATLTLNGPTLQVLLGFTPSYGTVFEIVSGFGTLAGTPGEFDGRPDGSTFTVNTTEFQIDYNANDITLTVVPEPSSLGLVGILGVLGWLGRRRMRTR